MFNRLPLLAACTLAASVGCSSSNRAPSADGDGGVLVDGDGSVVSDVDVAALVRRIDTSRYLPTMTLNAAPGIIILNGLNLGPLTVASIGPGELSELNSETLASNGETIGEVGRQVLAYAYSCALPASSSMQLEIGGETWEFNGLLGLAPEWETGACDTECQEWVSACILARTNQFGTEVRLSLRGDHPALATSPAIRNQFTLREGSFYGNIFTGGEQIKGNAYACAGGEGSAKWEMTHRYCSAIGDGCPITTVADCNITNFACDANVSGCSSYTACSDWNDDALPTVCHSAKHQCGQATSGTSYSRVITAYLEPPAESCGDGLCNENEANSCPADCTGQWAERFGSGCHEDAGGLSVDQNGNISIVGRFMGNLDMGGTVHSTDDNSDRDLFVASLSSSGDVRWSKSLDSAGSRSMIRSVTNDSDGNVIIAGHFANATNLGDGNISATGFTLFVAKYAAADGAHIWSKVLPMNTSIFSNNLEELPNVQVAADSADGIVLAAGFVKTLDLGLGSGNPSNVGNYDDIVIARFDSSGNYDWHSVIASTTTQSIEGPARIGGIALDANDDVVVGGTFRGEIAVGGTTLTAASNTDSDGFVAKLSSTGTHLWAAQVSGKEVVDPMNVVTNDQKVLDVAIGSEGQIMVVGSYVGKTSIAGAPTIESNVDIVEGLLTNPDSFVAQFTASGNLTWSSHFGAGRTDIAQQIDWDGVDSYLVSAIVTSELGSSVLVEDRAIMAGEMGDIALIRYDTVGQVRSVTHHPSPVTEETKGLVATATSAIMSGEFMGTLRFGGTYLTNAGGSSNAVQPGDIFVTTIDTPNETAP